MKKEMLYECFKEWVTKISDGNVNPSVLFNSAEVADVNEIYQQNDLGINETYESIILPCESSKTGRPQFFMFRSIDFLVYDSSGDVKSVTPLSYDIL